MDGHVHECAVFYDIDGRTLVPVFGHDDIVAATHNRPRRVMVDYVPAGHFVEHEPTGRYEGRTVFKVHRYKDDRDMAVRLRERIRRLSHNLSEHRAFRTRSEWEAGNGVFEGVLRPDGHLIKYWTGLYGTGIFRDTQILCLKTFSNYLRIEGVEDGPSSVPYQHGQHPGLVEELWTHPSCLAASAPYTLAELEAFGPDFVLANIRARLNALYDFPVTVRRSRKMAAAARVRNRHLRHMPNVDLRARA